MSKGAFAASLCITKKVLLSIDKRTFYSWGIGIRTPTNRVRVCRAAVTQFPNILLKRDLLYHCLARLSTEIFKKIKFFRKNLLGECEADV